MYASCLQDLRFSFLHKCLSASSRSSSLSSDGSVREAPPLRLRPLEFHTPAWHLRSLRPAGDFVCFVLFPSLLGLLGSYRDGSEFLVHC